MMPKTIDFKEMEDKLKPCPFCGRKPRIIDVQNYSFRPSVFCLECCMTFYIEEDNPEDVRTVYSAAEARGQLILPPTFPEPRTFIDIWNNRVGEKEE